MFNIKHLIEWPRGTLRVEGKQNSLFPAGPVIKCFLYLPTQKITCVSKELRSVLFSFLKLCCKFCSLQNSFKVLTAFCVVLFVDFELLSRQFNSISSSVLTWKRFAAMTEKNYVLHAAGHNFAVVSRRTT